MAQMVVTTGSLLRSVLLPFILSALLVLNFPVVNRAVGDILSMTSRIQSVEASGIKVAFGDVKKLASALTLTIGTELAKEKQQPVIDAVRQLTAGDIERLFTFDPAQAHCIYSKDRKSVV